MSKNNERCPEGHDSVTENSPATLKTILSCLEGVEMVVDKRKGQSEKSYGFFNAFRFPVHVYATSMNGA